MSIRWPVRNRPGGDIPYDVFLEEVIAVSLKAFENQDVQLEELIERLNIKRDLSRNPLFDVLLIGQNYGLPQIAGQLPNHSGMQAPVEYGTHTAKFDLTIAVIEAGDDIYISIEYYTPVFSTDTIQRMAGHLSNIISSVVEQPSLIIDRIDIMSPEERDRLVYDFNDSEASFPEDQTIHRLFEEQAAKTPDNIAVAGPFSSISYRLLDERSGQLAGYLMETHGIHPEEPVALLMSPTLDMVVAILAILKAGGAYVPMSPSLPEQRLRYMIDDAAIRVIVSETGYGDILSSLREHCPALGNCILADDDCNANGGKPNSRKSSNVPFSLAYIIYTSGTTGKPKGVLIQHRNVVRLLINDKNPFDFNSRDIWTMFHAYSFDFSVWEMYGPLLNGGKLILVDHETARNTNVFHHLLKRETVTVLNQTPAAFYNLSFLEVNSPATELHLRYVIFGGDVLSPGKLRHFKEKYPATALINMYGITETTVHVTFKRIETQDIENGISNVGVPIPTLCIFILGNNLTLLPIGASGEIYVGGQGVSRGYLNRPQLTSERFVDLTGPFQLSVLNNLYKTGDLARWLFNGDIEFLGRADHQVKIRGYRIELGEIESRLLEHPSVRSAVVLDRQSGDAGEKYLCAWLVKDENSETTDTPELAEYLARFLPDYMIPAHFMFIDDVPLTISGKLDKKALPDPSFKPGNNYVAPRSPLEKELAKIWETVLWAGDVIGEQSIGIDDNFFDLGGHSLKAAALTVRIHKELNVEVPLTQLFRNPTLRELARFIEHGNLSETSFYAVKPAEEREYYTLSPVQKSLFTLQILYPDSTFYNMPVTLMVNDDLDRDKLENIFKHIIQRHEILRTSFHMMDETPVQQIHHDVDFQLETVTENNLHKKAVSGKDASETVIPLAKLIRPFDPGAAPLVRACLVTGESSPYLVVDMHHIIADHISHRVLAREFSRLRDGEPLAAVPVQYRDYTTWEARNLREEKWKKQEKFWLSCFDGELPELRLPIDFPRPERNNFEGNGVAFHFSVRETQSIKTMARDSGATVFVSALSIFVLLLSGISGQDDIVIGIPVSRRRHPDLEQVIGIFLNTLPVRFRVDRSLTVPGFMKQVNQTWLQAFENQDYPLEELVAAIAPDRKAGREPLFDVMFNFPEPGDKEDNIPDRDSSRHRRDGKPGEQVVEDGGSGAGYVHYPGTAKTDLGVDVYETNNRLSFFFEYSTQLFKPRTIEDFLESLKQITDFIIKKTGGNVEDIKISHGYTELRTSAFDDGLGDF